MRTKLTCNNWEELESLNEQYIIFGTDLQKIENIILKDKNGITKSKTSFSKYLPYDVRIGVRKRVNGTMTLSISQRRQRFNSNAFRTAETNIIERLVESNVNFQRLESIHNIMKQM